MIILKGKKKWERGKRERRITDEVDGINTKRDRDRDREKIEEWEGSREGRTKEGG